MDRPVDSGLVSRLAPVALAEAYRVVAGMQTEVYRAVPSSPDEAAELSHLGTVTGGLVQMLLDELAWAHKDMTPCYPSLSPQAQPDGTETAADVPPNPPA